MVQAMAGLFHLRGLLEYYPDIPSAKTGVPDS
jgi:hypothetical protein